MSNTYSRVARTRILSTLVSALWCSAGCADILDLPDSPGLVTGDRWDCSPIVEQPRKATAHVTVHVCDYFSANCGTPVRGVTAQLCNRKDFGCKQPVSTGIMDVGENGDLSFDVRTGGPSGEGFDGYLLVMPPVDLCTNEAAFGGSGACAMTGPECDPAAPDPSVCSLPLFIPGLLFFDPPITNDLTRQMELPLLPWLGAVSFITAAGSTSVDPALGSVLATALDCDGHPASGISFAAETGAPQFGTLYQNGGVATKGRATDDTGVGGLLGIPERFVEISAHLAGDGLNAKPLAASSIQVLASTVSYVTLSPAYK